MKKWHRVLWTDLGIAIVFASFMSVFFGTAFGKIFGGAVGLVTGVIAGLITFLGGARIAFRIAHDLRLLPPATKSESPSIDPTGGLRWDGSRSPGWEREPLLTDVIFILVGLVEIAVGYTRQFNAIDYPPGDVRGTPAFDAAFLTFTVVIGLFAIVVGSIRLAQGLRRRRP